MELYEEILINSFNYKGTMFWENYILSNLVKTFAEDYSLIGQDAITGYKLMYGKSIEPLLDYMIENEQELFKAGLLESTFLFEEIGEMQVLNEIDAGITNLKRISSLLSKSKGINSMNLAGYVHPNVSMGSAGLKDFAINTTIKKSGTTLSILGFLRGLWQKLKDAGKQVFANIIPFLKKGYSWAKNIVSKGIGWIASNPIAKVVVPALLVTGGTVAAIKLINKARKKKRMKPMSKQEREEFIALANKNKQKVYDYARKVGIDPRKIKIAA